MLGEPSAGTLSAPRSGDDQMLMQGELAAPSVPSAMQGPRAVAAGDMAGVRVLVVEDEVIIAAMIEDVLVDAGCVIAGVASTLEAALDHASLLACDAAILDVRLHERHTDAVAERLTLRKIPFLVATGYVADNLPAPFAPAPILAKPFRGGDLLDAFSNLIRQARGKPQSAASADRANSGDDV